jgi:site-specific DNA-methyltransferase (adenine-specific)
MINLYNQDCLEAMKKMDDNSYDLAIVDPPYGIADNPSRHKGSGALKNRVLNSNADKFALWDKTPPKEYFDQLFRVSKKQIIWGGNYFDLPPSRCVICWNKKQPWENFSQWEMGWTSFDYPAPMFTFDNRYQGKIHPTQKPVELYVWCLNRFGKQGDKILDTHLGSGSIAIACHNLGYDLDGYELDVDYYEAASKRLKEHQRQLRLF